MGKFVRLRFTKIPSEKAAKRAGGRSLVFAESGSAHARNTASSKPGTIRDQ